MNTFNIFDPFKGKEKEIKEQRRNDLIEGIKEQANMILKHPEEKWIIEEAIVNIKDWVNQL